MKSAQIAGKFFQQAQERGVLEMPLTAKQLAWIDATFDKEQELAGEVVTAFVETDGKCIGLWNIKDRNVIEFYHIHPSVCLTY